MDMDICLTKEQEDALYKRFVDRYGEELTKRFQCSKRGSAMLLNEAKDYFYDVLDRESKRNSMLKPALYSQWDKITRLTCLVFGASYIYDIPTDMYEFANEFTIEIASLVIQAWLDVHMGGKKEND